MINKPKKLHKINIDQTSQMILSHLGIAESFWLRGKGLLGTHSLEENSGLWIKPCRDIHTFFMSFAIDCVFLDNHFKIVKLNRDVKPFRIVGPYWKANSVIEVNSGFINKWQLNEGDQLYVVD